MVDGHYITVFSLHEIAYHHTGLSEQTFIQQKSHVSYRMAPISMTLSDREGTLAV